MVNNESFKIFEFTLIKKLLTLDNVSNFTVIKRVNGFNSSGNPKFKGKPESFIYFKDISDNQVYQVHSVILNKDMREIYFPWLNPDKKTIACFCVINSDEI